jgi:hypothetical protein
MKRSAGRDESALISAVLGQKSTFPGMMIFENHWYNWLFKGG